MSISGGYGPGAGTSAEFGGVIYCTLCCAHTSPLDGSTSFVRLGDGLRAHRSCADLRGLTWATIA